MILIAFFCFSLLNFGLTAGQVYTSDEKVTELNEYILENYIARLNNDFPDLEARFAGVWVKCETEVNRTIDICLDCKESNQNSSGQSGGRGKLNLDKLILGLVPAPLGLVFRGNFAKKFPKFFTKTIPKIGETGVKHVGKFFTGTLPDTGKKVGKFIEKKIGKPVKTFFTKTLPGVGKKIGEGFKKFGDLFGRRRRAASQCPSCDLIDTESKSSEQIDRDVCGDAAANIFREYANTVAILNWLIEGNNIVTKVSYRKSDMVKIPSHNIHSAKPFTVTYSIGLNDTPKNYKETTASLNIADSTSTNKAFGKALADKIWNEYVFGA
ncbi:uncharacterized protein LOC117332822 isoform X2 [Pecten maximus]|uniref:uncharacterized protein LOC117332822 isoform X2 n=1 Tax=Pecten maximus TaxID=6579 RepID=UPI001458FAE4|nr:uncharacterized protein LOC117332822 isoform X2 [Pecten maximus]